MINYENRIKEIVKYTDEQILENKNEIMEIKKRFEKRIKEEELPTEILFICYCLGVLYKRLKNVKDNDLKKRNIVLKYYSNFQFD